MMSCQDWVAQQSSCVRCPKCSCQILPVMKQWRRFSLFLRSCHAQCAAWGNREPPRSPCRQGPRKSVRLERIFLDKSKSCGQFWSETTCKTNRQAVSGHLIAFPCCVQIPILFTIIHNMDNYPWYGQLFIPFYHLSMPWKQNTLFCREINKLIFTHSRGQN